MPGVHFFRSFRCSTIDGSVLLILRFCLRNDQNQRSQTVAIRNMKARYFRLDSRGNFDQEH